jgi:hypothetical protein
MYPRGPQDLRRRTETIPVKYSHTRIRIKPLALALASGHGRHTRTDTCVRWGMSFAYLSRYKLVTVSLPKQFRNGRFNPENALRRFQKRNRHLDPEALYKIRCRWPLELLESSRYNSFSRRGRGAMGVVIETCVKYPGVQLE